MYANAAEAINGLRYGGQPHGRILDERTVARNTKLIRFDDELIGLRLHATAIAMYHPDGVRFDLRGPGSPTGEGWFTDVTLRRLEEFTPARFTRNAGLTFVIADPSYGEVGWRDLAPSRLYAHGCAITSDYSFENGLDPLVERALVQTASNWNRLARSYAKRVTTAWRRFGSSELPECCRQADVDGNVHLHEVGHIQRRDIFVPHQAHLLACSAKEQGMYGDDLLRFIERELAERYLGLRDIAVKGIEPNFPYPQQPPRRR
jgi:hypothetical protein